MGYDLRYPMITGNTEKEQLIQIKSYLHQLVEQLQWSLNNIDKVQIQYINTPVKSDTSKKADEKGTQATFDALKPLIIDSAEILDAYYEKINEKLKELYVLQSDLETLEKQIDSNFLASDKKIEDINNEISKIKTSLKSIEEKYQGLDNELSDTKEKLSLISNYVTETGESNGWKYKKWNDGTFEMFGTFTVITTAAGTAYGNMYCSEQFILPAPFAVSNFVVSCSSNNWLIPITGELEGEYDPSYYLGFKILSPSQIAVGDQLSVMLHVTGEYEISIQEEQ